MTNPTAVFLVAVAALGTGLLQEPPRPLPFRGHPPGAARPGIPTDSFPFRPDTTLDVPGGPQVHILRTPGSPLVSLEVVVPLREGATEAGSGRVLQHVQLERVRALGGQVGARVDGRRTPRGLTYTVTGPREELDNLAWLLRRTVEEPRPNRGATEEAVTRARAALAQRLETAEGYLTARLQDRVWPTRPPLDGTPASLNRITPASLRDFWARTHQAHRMTLVVVGEVEPVLVLANLTGIGAPPELEGPPPEAAPPPGPPPAPGVQVLRSWYGEAFVVEDGSDPRPAVAALLLGETLRRAGPELEGSVELWESGPASALVVVAAGYPGRGPAIRRAVRGLTSTTAEGLTATSVARASARVREEVLLAGRTPWGMAELVGRRAEETGDPRAAEHFLERLDGVDRETMVAYLRAFVNREPIREELEP